MQISSLNQISESTSARPAPGEKVPESTGVKFEAMILQVLFEDLMPDLGAVYGSGLSGDYWKSQMAQIIAGQIAQSGGAGFAQYVDGQS